MRETTVLGRTVEGENGTGVCRLRAPDERGQVVVLFALLLPVLLALSAVVLDVGNMYVHKKHNQTLVDAGAFAGATKFVGCSFQFGDPVAANQAIRTTALQYAGDTYRSPGTYNRQVQKPEDVRVVLNSARWWSPGDPMDGVGLDDTLDADGDPLTAGDPCSSRTLDVKATDHDVPLLTNLIPLRPDAKSKARVEIRQVKEQMGILPFAVPEIEPAAVAAIFVDEDTGNVNTMPQLLCKVSTCTGLPAPDDKLSYWSTTVGNDLVNLASDNTGVVILVSKEDDTPSLATGGPGTLASMCNQSPDLVKCYAGSGNQSGLTFVHSWSEATPATPAAPKIRDAQVVDINCGTDDKSAPYFLLTGDCTLGARVTIDFGFAGDPRPNPPSGIKAVVKLKAPGCGNQGCTMAYEGRVGTDTTWFAAGAFMNPAVGRTTFSVQWSTEWPSHSDHGSTFLGVGHPFVANDTSGPVLYLKLGTNDTGILDANSRPQGTRSVVVTVGLNKPLEIRDPLAPALLLRYASPTGSLTQALDCDNGIPFKDEIENGCQTPYGLNYDNWDQNPTTPKTWADITCSRYGNGDLPPAAPLSPAPICVAAKTGQVTSFRQGLKARFESPCVPNNWPKDHPPTGRDPADDARIRDFFTNYDFANDPRYVTLIITDITAFEGSGSTNVPIKYFAGFYATGWDVGPQNNGCPDNDPHPLGLGPNKDDGDVWGHFVNIVIFSAMGLSSDELCNFDEVGTCIAVLVE